MLAGRIATHSTGLSVLLNPEKSKTGREEEAIPKAVSTTVDQARKAESSQYAQKLKDCLSHWSMTVEGFQSHHGDLPYPTFLQVDMYSDYNYRAISDKVNGCKLSPARCNNDTVIVRGYEFTVLFNYSSWQPRDQENRRMASGELTFGRNLLAALRALKVLLVYAHEPSDARFFARVLNPYVRVTFMGMGRVEDEYQSCTQSNVCFRKLFATEGEVLGLCSSDRSSHQLD